MWLDGSVRVDQGGEVRGGTCHVPKGTGKVRELGRTESIS